MLKGSGYLPWQCQSMTWMKVEPRITMDHR